MSSSEPSFNGGFDSVSMDDIESVIERVVGVKAVLEEKYDTARRNPKDRVQVRLDPNNAPTYMVDRYRLQMGRAAFPPPVVTKDGYCVDGNTRFAAYAEREERYISAYVIPIAFESASEDERLRLHLLGGLLNSRNGLPLHEDEQRSLVRDALRLNMSDRQISQNVGVQIKLVQKVRSEVRGEERAAAVGLDVEDVKPAQPTARDRTRLAAIGNLPPMPEKALRETVKLAVDTKMPAGELKALGASVQEAGSEELALDRIKREREARAPQIAAVKAGEKVRTPLAGQLRRNLGMVLNHDPQDFVEHNAEYAQDHLARCEKALEVLGEVVVLQREVNAGGS